MNNDYNCSEILDELKDFSNLINTIEKSSQEGVLSEKIVEGMRKAIAMFIHLCAKVYRKLINFIYQDKYNRISFNSSLISEYEITFNKELFIKLSNELYSIIDVLVNKQNLAAVYIRSITPIISDKFIDKVNTVFKNIKNYVSMLINDTTTKDRTNIQELKGLFDKQGNINGYINRIAKCIKGLNISIKDLNSLSPEQVKEKYDYIINEVNRKFGGLFKPRMRFQNMSDISKTYNILIKICNMLYNYHRATSLAITRFYKVVKEKEYKGDKRVPDINFSVSVPTFFKQHLEKFYGDKFKLSKIVITNLSPHYWGNSGDKIFKYDGRDRGVTQGGTPSTTDPSAVYVNANMALLKKLEAGMLGTFTVVGNIIQTIVHECKHVFDIQHGVIFPDRDEYSRATSEDYKKYRSFKTEDDAFFAEHTFLATMKERRWVKEAIISKIDQIYKEHNSKK